MKIVKAVVLFALLGGQVFAEGFDRFGGCKAIKGEATGFFHLEKVNGRYFFMTPEGHGFRALGINHFHMIKSTNYDEIIEDLKAMGFNSGCYQGPRWMWKRFPYTKGINLLHTSSWLPPNKFRFDDVFDPEYLRDLEERVKAIVVPQAENEMLICWFLTDIPVWTNLKNGKGWVDFYKSLDANSPGGREWRKWRTANPDAPAEEFIPLIARQVYAEGTRLIRKYDSNHLIFSDRYHEYTYAEDVVKEALPFMDGIAIQPKNHMSVEFLEKVSASTGLPVFIADFVSSYATPEHAKTMGQVTDNPDDYLQFYRVSVYDVLPLPCVVGINKCQYMNEESPKMLKQGLYRKDETPYEYLGGLKEAHERALKKTYSIRPE